MAVSNSGVPGTYSGKVGNTVYYFSNGRWVSRSAGRITKPASPAKLACNQRMGVCSAAMRQLKPFINIGFRQKAISNRDNAHNAANSYNMRNAMKGEYPDIGIDFSLLRLSEGPLMPAQEFSVMQVTEGLQFNWFADPNALWPDYTDQVMMLAYFPALGKIVFELYGAARSQGVAVLPVSQPMQSEYMETYISFVAADRSATATSRYTGSINGMT
jgi:hypothetical protein